MLPRTDFLFNENESLKIENADLKTRVERNEQKLKHYESELERMQEMLADFKRMKFGVRSERWETSEQLVFNEVEALCLKPEAPEELLNNEIKVDAHTKKRGHRRALPGELEREVVEIFLPENEQKSPEGEALKVIGFEVSEKLSYTPASTKVLEIRRAKYGVDYGDYEKTAPHAPEVIARSIATPELVASIVSQKYAYGLPLYRQEELFFEMGVHLPRQTMARWVVKYAEACQGVYNILQDRLFESDYVSCDETHTQVLKETGRTAESKSYMWVRSTPHGKNRIILFEYDPHRSSDVAKRLLTEFRGYLQTDGFVSYDILEAEVGIMHFGCNMHGRRYFEKAKTVGAKSGKTLAESGLQFYKKLYDSEEDWRKHDPGERFKKRNEVHEPIWAEFKSWVDENHRKVPPKSKIGEAFTYFLNQYERLKGYLKDGRLEMDNGFVERAIRKFAIGRNNWMFADTEAGADASAMFYSILCTAKINGVNTYEVLKYLFTEIPKDGSFENLERLADIIVGLKQIPGP